MRGKIWIAVLGGAALTAGCGTDERAEDRSAPMRFAPADSDRSGAQGADHGLPAGHPPSGSASGPGGREVLRTGPFAREFPEAGLTFSVPAGWMELKPSGMDRGVIDARIAIPVDEAESMLTMSSTGGGIDLNIDRWKGQFPEATAADQIVEPIQVGGAAATWVALRGRYQDPFRPARPEHADWTVLGAAIPREGRSDFYLKLSGPRAAVERVRDEFRRFVEEARVE